ncbi:heat shock protein 90-5, chloroplastic-like [Lactuca sativa]|uniref:heat shock protein 90-5, chloroplastic-like n=1 Tax=Lactuca sativa TaxID=4236 RepID=UPI001C690AEB|nr:heat shock protein 90-5, chloroplastic-like [Lactuca sativa]
MALVATFVSFPISTWQEKSRTVEVEEEPKEGEETPSEMRNPKEIEKDQYSEFYKKTFNEFLDPLAYTHFTIEGEVEFRSVIYIPGMAPMNNEDVVNPKTKNIRLYVKQYETEEIADYVVRLFTGLVTLYNKTLRFGMKLNRYLDKTRPP